ncbi:hypothetical protein [Shewanella sp. Isolate11]|uniref:hypothetical protein n=1 Tax=Shewanella sp. Isolate11 TaxID=2908530 RepID=UPI001EFC9768|nr:hypothetical protein [Shewanella sp. Isolate11]MCG9697397.1 hypothetical protein [Shewanella sp. Isolate11]
MRMIGMLLALLIIGMLIYKQLGQGTQLSQQAAEINEASTGNVPKVPVNPNEIEQFDKDMNQFMKEEAEKREKALKEAQEQ